MEIRQFPNGRGILVCSEIWGIVDYKNTREFVISADKSKLFEILKETEEEEK